jgi:germination protein M
VGGTSLGRKIVLVLVVMAIAIAALYLYMRIVAIREKAPLEVHKVPEETRSVTIFFGNKGADAFLSEAREVPVEEGFEAQVRAVLGELIKGTQDREKVSAIPAGTELIQVYWIEDSQTLFLDFNRAFVANHPGGSAGEYFTIGTILKTISANFPQVSKVQFMVDGYPVETIAGHYAVDKPIEIQKWR